MTKDAEGAQRLERWSRRRSGSVGWRALERRGRETLGSLEQRKRPALCVGRRPPGPGPGRLPPCCPEHCGRDSSRLRCGGIAARLNSTFDGWATRSCAAHPGRKKTRMRGKTSPSSPDADAERHRSRGIGEIGAPIPLPGAGLAKGRRRTGHCTQSLSCRGAARAGMTVD